MQSFDWRESFLVGDDIFVAGFKGLKADVFRDVEADDLICLDLE